MLSTVRRSLFGLAVAAHVGIGLQEPVWADSTDAVWRVQVYLKTADVSNAGTDDPISVSLSTNNSTTLNYSHNDFERNDSYTYDLSLDDIATVGDITWLEISKTGSNGWCLKSCSLIINGKTAYTKTYSSGHWLDNSDSHDRTLTLTPNLTGFSNPSFVTYSSGCYQHTFTDAEMESRVESMVGDAMAGLDMTSNIDLGLLGELTLSVTSLSWAADPSVWRKDGDELSVDADLAAVVDVEVFGDVDVAIDIDLDLRFSCSDVDDDGDDDLLIEGRNLDVDADLDGNLLQDIVLAILDIFVDLEDLVADRVSGAFPDLDPSYSIPGDYGCPTITTESDGDVVLKWCP